VFSQTQAVQSNIFIIYRTDVRFGLLNAQLALKRYLIVYVPSRDTDCRFHAVI